MKVTLVFLLSSTFLAAAVESPSALRRKKPDVVSIEREKDLDAKRLTSESELPKSLLPQPDDSWKTNYERLYKRPSDPSQTHPGERVNERVVHPESHYYNSYEPIITE